MARSTYPLLLATYALLIVGANGLTLIQHLAATADLAELAKSVNTSSYNLYDTWNQMGPFTVFGPRNASFTVASVAEKVKALDAAASAGNPAGIQALINGHIVYGAYPAATLTNGLTMQTISGQTLTVYNTGTGSIYIDNMLVVSADATVSKDSQTSYVHITDAVNFPPTSRTILQGLQALPGTFSTLAKTAVDANVADVLASGSYTLFAPINSAFTVSPASDLMTLYSDASQKANILKFHLVKGIIDTSALVNNSKLPTVQGGELNVMINHLGQVFVNQAIVGSVTSSTNGKFYQIDKVLVPSLYRDVPASLTADPARFTILSGLITNAGMVSALTQTSLVPTANFTLFAPIDDAWANLGWYYGNYPGDATVNTEYVKMHAMSGRNAAASLQNGQSLTMLNGRTVEVYINGVDVYIGNAKVIKTDITASNGIIHYVDGVLIPTIYRNTLQVLQAYPASYSTLLTAIAAADLSYTIGNLTTDTLLAPTNDAFAKYPTRVNNLLKKAGYGDKTELQTLLKYHLITAGAYSSSQLYSSSSFSSPSAQGDDIIFTREGSSAATFKYFTDGAQFILAKSDVSTAGTGNTQGYVHQIDDIIWPTSMRTIYQFLQADRVTYKSLKNAVDLAGLVETLTSRTVTLIGWNEDTLSSSNTAKVLVDSLVAAAEAEVVTGSGTVAKEKLKIYLEYAILNNAQNFGTAGQYGLQSGSMRQNLCPADGSCGPSGRTVEVYFSTAPAETRVDNVAMNIAAGKSATNGYLQILSGGILVPPTYQNLYQALRSRPTTFSRLLSTITTTDFGNSLAQPGDFTFFAPTDAAFTSADTYGAPITALSSDELQKLLQYHLVRGKLTNAVLREQYKAQTAKGLSYTVDTVFGTTLEVYIDANDRLYVNNMIVDDGFKDIACTNGVFHYVQDVAIQPPIRNALQQIQASPATYSTLLSALTKASLLTYVATTTGYTLFAPTNSAFTAVVGQVTRYMTETPSTNLTALLQYHIFTGGRLVAPGDFTMNTLAMLAEPTTPANIVTKNNQLYIDIATISATDQFTARNAQVHQIGSVLFPKSLRNVAEVVQGDTPTFYTLGIALQKAGLVPTLSTSTEYTLFAPTDQAFAQPSVSAMVQNMLNADNPAALRSFLSYHVVPGRKLAADLTALSGQPLKAISDFNISVTVTGGVIKVNDANITSPASPMLGTNGLIHQIDAVLLPPDMRTILGVLKSTPYQFSTIESYIVAAGLADTLNGAEEYTLFAPPNTALPGNANTQLQPFYDAAINGTNSTPLSNFLQYHLVKGKKSAAQLTNQTLRTVLGETINIMTASNGTVYINDAPISTDQSKRDIAATNGVVHVLSDTSVLWPSSTRNGLMFVKADPAQYSTLDTLLATCSLDTYLSDPTKNFTLFAPTAAAFAQAGIASGSSCTSAVKSTLEYHVVLPRFSIESLTSGMTLETLSPKTAAGRRLLNQQTYKLEVWRPASSSDIYINNAKLVITKSAAVTNGYAYQLDSVLVPDHLRNIMQWTEAVPSKFFVLTATIAFANLTEVLTSSHTNLYNGTTQFQGVGGAANKTQKFTVFAPNSAAFTLNRTEVEVLMRNRSNPALQEILLNHIVYGEWTSPLKVGTVMRAVSGISITINTKDGKFYANGAELASLEGIKATNGVIYEIKSIIFNALPIPATAITPPSMSLVPKGMCPEYAAVLTGSKVKIATYISGPAKGAAFVTAKRSADGKSMVVTAVLDNPLATPGEQSFGKEVKSITIRGPVKEGNGDAAFSFEYDYTVCSKNTPACTPQSVFTRVFKVTNQILADMDAGMYYVEITNGLNEGLRGTLTRQACYESYLNKANIQATASPTQSAYAMVMVDPTSTEILVQLAAKHMENVSAVRLFGQMSSPNLDKLDVLVDDGAYEWTFMDREWDGQDAIAMSYMRPGFVVTKEMLEDHDIDIKNWVDGFKTGQYYLRLDQYDPNWTASVAVPVKKSLPWLIGRIYEAMPCPSLAAYGVDKKDYFTSFNTGSSAYVISQARLDAYRRTVLIMVKVIKAPDTAITGIAVTEGEDGSAIREVLSLGPVQTDGFTHFARFYLQDFDLFNFQQGRMNFVVRTAAHPNGEVRGRYQMSTCYLSEFIPTVQADQQNTAFTSLQVSMDGTEAFLNFVAMNTTTEDKSTNASLPFQDATGTAEESNLLNVLIANMNGISRVNSNRLPGMAPPPVMLQDRDNSTRYPLMHVTFGGTASEMSELTTKLVLGQVSQTATGLTSSTISSPIKIKVVEDPSKYIVEEGDTLATIAKKKGFDTWVPLQMVNRLTTLTLQVGQVLDLCYRHRVMPNETIKGIADNYGLEFEELYPLNPQLFDRKFIYEGQDVCVMPALKRIMCGYKGAYTVGMTSA